MDIETKFEYKTLWLSSWLEDKENTQKKLNSYASDGWRVVSTIFVKGQSLTSNYIVAVLERPISKG